MMLNVICNAHSEMYASLLITDETHGQINQFSQHISNAHHFKMNNDESTLFPMHISN